MNQSKLQANTCSLHGKTIASQKSVLFCQSLKHGKAKPRQVQSAFYAQVKTTLNGNLTMVEKQNTQGVTMSDQNEASANKARED